MNSKNYKDAMDNVKASEKLKKETLSKITTKKKYGFTIFKIVSIMCIFLFVFAIAKNNNSKPDIVMNEEDKDVKLAIEDNIKLPTVDSYEKLVELLDKNREEVIYYTERETKAELVMDTAKNSNNEEKNYSETNTQVKGVDEADIVKTDGKNIYYVVKEYNGYGIAIINVNTNEKVNKIEYDNNEIYPSKIFLYKDKLIVIGNRYQNNKTVIEETETTSKRYLELANVAYIGNSMTTIVVYDVSDVLNIKEIRKVEIEGNYISSRMIEENIYVISSKNLYQYYYGSLREDELQSTYLDTAISDDLICKDYKDIYYFPESEESNYLNVASFNVNNLEDANVKTFLGAGSNVYCSENNLYITKTNWNYKMIEDSTAETSIYKISLNGTKLVLEAETKIPGMIINQFSLDEYNGNLRIAVTKYNSNSSEDTSNNLYILDSKLSVIGSIENMAEGEEIYSIRFMGNKGYIVTFKQIDPLFVIDLSNPINPSVVGELKIPGYSSYLHPYDENHIIGFGKDAAVVANEEGSWGWVDEDNTAAYYQGMKIAMFDVTDPTKPIEMWKEEIGDRGTESELLNNHKALLFSKEKNLLAFPIRVAQIKDKNVKAWTYGDTTFVGAYVYELTLENGFRLKAKLTNLDENDWKRLGNYYYGDKSIDRLIYIGNNLYTIADSGYSAYDMTNDFEKVGELKLGK